MNREPLVKMEYMTGADGMQYPNLQISADEKFDKKETGRFGSQWKEYMKEKHPQRLSELIATGMINEMICKVDEEAEQKKEALIQQLLNLQPMPETEDTLARAGHMELITRKAEEIILEEVIYQVR